MVVSCTNDKYFIANNISISSKIPCTKVKVKEYDRSFFDTF